jgi:hypothetical protein
MTLRLARLFAGSLLPPPSARPGRTTRSASRSAVSTSAAIPCCPRRRSGRAEPFTGQGRDFGDVQRALEALEAVYHARGYSVVTVQLPEQELNGGVVRLNVIQTRNLVAP